jgi:hypothetical protein
VVPKRGGGGGEEGGGRMDGRLQHADQKGAATERGRERERGAGGVGWMQHADQKGAAAERGRKRERERERCGWGGCSMLIPKGRRHGFEHNGGNLVTLFEDHDISRRLSLSPCLSLDVSCLPPLPLPPPPSLCLSFIDPSYLPLCQCSVLSLLILGFPTPSIFPSRE